MRVYVLGDRRKGSVRAVLDALLPWLRDRVEVVGVELDGKPLDRVRADLLLVLGGDGSILGAARRLAGNAVPTLGVNLGRLGFLAAVRPEEVRGALERVFEGRHEVEERMMLDLEVRAGAKRRWRGPALNDGVVERTRRAGMITVEVRLGGKGVTAYRGDGLIVSTPTGATGYGLSAGGPIVGPGLDAFIVTPICPHTLTNRPLVVPADEPVELRVPEAPEGALFIADGQERVEIGPKDRVLVARAKARFRLVTVGGDYYARLRGTLGWRGAFDLQDPAPPAPPVVRKR
ncbi:MAG TPA: NAD(+)/NADH kinase [Planctomycetota bacterium]|jgi:NAD+ kinase|nr:NAD(+)/NADH kinase [Planctomycetota bacterium]